MAALLPSASVLQFTAKGPFLLLLACVYRYSLKELDVDLIKISFFGQVITVIIIVEITSVGKLGGCRLTHFSFRDAKRIRFQYKPLVVKAMCAGSPSANSQKKKVWVWTEKKEVMTAAVERGWNTFIFHSDCRELAAEWSSIALLFPLFIEEGGLFDGEHMKIASFFEISSPEQLEKLQPLNEQAENVVVNLLDWQAIPAENIVAAIQGSEKTVFAISKTSSEAQMFLEALEHGLGGVVLKTEDVGTIIELKNYLDRRNDKGSLLELTKATVTNIQMVGMGDRVCVDLCSLMKPGEGLLVGSFARGLFLVHSECLESNYISSRPFRVNATGYLSELKAGKEVIVVDQNGMQRTAVIGRVKIETRPLILVEAKGPETKSVPFWFSTHSFRTKLLTYHIHTRNAFLEFDMALLLIQRDQDNQTSYSILLQNAETVALVSSSGASGHQRTAIPVTSLKLGDEILLRVQGGARHTGIEIEEFIVEK
ncbi:hypothetical protein DH2020_009359 [Rehmannia glutinosa]|uniref:3-dehydroquinate synthase n=1 Tax=Rehmannia glutinosa TaxID=99300 RepID=A0ABR0X7C3_REHGL